MLTGRIWYCSSVKYNAVSAWAATHAYSIGDFVRATLPTTGNLHIFRCTTAGTSAGSEPAWSLTTIGTSTTTSGTAVFTLVTGLDTYGWSAAAGHTSALNGVATSGNALTAGDIVAIDSSHTQTQASALNLSAPSTSLATPVMYISVNASGSVPPTNSDYQSGASVATTGPNSIGVNNSGHAGYIGITFDSGASIQVNSNANFPLVLRNCLLWLDNATSGSRITSNNPAKMLWDNVQVKFGAVGQAITAGFSVDLDWRNTASAVQGATLPTALFIAPPSVQFSALVHGVDLSALGSGQALVDITGVGSQSIFAFYQCKLAAGVVASINPSATSAGATVELYDCDSSNTQVRAEKHTQAGDLTTDTSVTRVSGANGFGMPYSHKLQTSNQANPQTNALISFPLLIPGPLAGASRTVTIEVLANEPVTLNPNDQDSRITLSNGNLTAQLTASSTFIGARGTTFLNSGKWYWEVSPNTIGSSANWAAGMANILHALTAEVFSTNSVGYQANGSFAVESASLGFGMPTFTNTDIVCFAADFDNGLIYARKNGGNWNNSGTANPATQTGGGSIVNLLKKGPLVPAWCGNTNNDKVTFNFGASAFAFAAPSGFSAIGGSAIALLNSELLLDVDYINGSTTPDGRVATTEASTPLSAGAALSSSAALWNNAPAAAVARKISVSFTPQSAGVLRAQLRFGGLAKQIWVDPLPQVA